MKSITQQGALDGYVNWSAEQQRREKRRGSRSKRASVAWNIALYERNEWISVEQANALDRMMRAGAPLRAVCSRLNWYRKLRGCNVANPGKQKARALRAALKRAQ